MGIRVSRLGTMVSVCLEGDLETGLRASGLWGSRSGVCIGIRAGGLAPVFPDVLIVGKRRPIGKGTAFAPKAGLLASLVWDWECDSLTSRTGVRPSSLSDSTF